MMTDPVHSTFTRLATALASLVSVAISASAGLVQTKVFSATELAYSADVSTTDLLAGKTASSVSGWNLTNDSTVAELNDGIHGRSFATAGNSVAGTWTTVGATATYNLGLGTNNLGYDLTSIQSIAAWLNVGFGNQAYTVDVKLVGATSFTSLATVDYQPLGSAVGATKVTLTDTTGVLATGVEYIRFTANSVNGGGRIPGPLFSAKSMCLARRAPRATSAGSRSSLPVLPPRPPSSATTTAISPMAAMPGRGGSMPGSTACASSSTPPRSSLRMICLLGATASAATPLSRAARPRCGRTRSIPPTSTGPEFDRR